jgi:phenylacetate-coenzyme A ligase PaaK-like adenylate-forming protein
MSAQIILRVLALRHRLRQRDWWTRPQLEAHQARELRLLRGYAYTRSPFYGSFHKGFSERPLHDLPILTKETVMEHFYELVTDPALRLADIDAHLAPLSSGTSSTRGKELVMQFWTIQPLPRERIGFAKS